MLNDAVAFRTDPDQVFFILPSVPDQPFLGLRIRIPVNLKPDLQSFSAMNVFKQLSF